MGEQAKRGLLKGCQRTYTSRTGEWNPVPPGELEWVKTTCALICGHNVICPSCASETNAALEDAYEFLDELEGRVHDISEIPEFLGSRSTQSPRLPGDLLPHASSAGQPCFENHTYPEVKDERPETTEGG